MAATAKTFISWDEGMLSQDEVSADTENKRRYMELLRQFHMSGLASVCERVASRLATAEELCLVHTEEYVRELLANGKFLNELTTQLEAAPVTTREEREAKRDLCRKFEDLKTEKLKRLREDTYTPLGERTGFAACLSAGCTLAVVESVVTASRQGTPSNGAAFVRPPGHHAKADKAAGFCIFNNVALAAVYSKVALGLKRVLIVDWDVHAGDGTAELVSRHEDILFFSMHRYDYRGFYPGGRETYVNNNSNLPDERTGGRISSRIINLPLLQRGDASRPPSFFDVAPSPFPQTAPTPSHDWSSSTPLHTPAYSDYFRTPLHGTPAYSELLQSSPPPPFEDRMISPDRSTLSPNQSEPSSAFLDDYVYPYGDEQYDYIFDELLMPIAHKFNPELVLVSAGFDAAAGDPLGRFFVSPSGFARMTARLKTLAGGRVVIVTEGGYHPYVFASCAMACLRELSGVPNPATEETRRMVNHVKERLRAVNML